MKNCDQKIAEAAYYIWQSQGCPEGMESVHWNMALDQLSSCCKKSSCATKKVAVKKASAPKKVAVKKSIKK